MMQKNATIVEIIDDEDQHSFLGPSTEVYCPYFRVLYINTVKFESLRRLLTSAAQKSRFMVNTRQYFRPSSKSYPVSYKLCDACWRSCGSASRRGTLMTFMLVNYHENRQCLCKQRISHVGPFDNLALEKSSIDRSHFKRTSSSSL